MRWMFIGVCTDSGGMDKGSYSGSIGKSIGIQQGFYKQRYSDSCGFHKDYIKNSKWLLKGFCKDSMLVLRDSVILWKGFYQDSVKSSM